MSQDQINADLALRIYNLQKEVERLRVIEIPTSTGGSETPILTHGNEADLAVLAEGEAGFAIDTKRLYVGDGAENKLINLNVGGSAGMLAAGDHTHSGIYAPDIHTHPNAQITGLGNSSTKDTGITSSTVAIGDHNHDSVYSLIGHTHEGLLEMIYTDTNMLINGGFDICQRSKTPETLFSIADNKYSADRWRVNTANASLQYQRLSATAYSNLSSMNHGRFTKITAAGKIAVYQPIESILSVACLNKTVQFQISMRVSATCTMNLGIVSLLSPAVADTIPTSFISSYNSDGLLPTFNTNLSLTTYSSYVVSASNTWTTYYITATIPSNAVNIIPIVWTDSAAPINFTLDLAEASLLRPTETTYSISNWRPYSPQLEYTNCLRYFEAQYNNPTDFYRVFATGFCYGGTTLQGLIRYSPKRKIPAITRSADSTVGWWKSNGVMLANSSATATAVIYVSESCCLEKDTFAAGNFAAGDGSMFSAYSTNAAWFMFDAEL